MILRRQSQKGYGDQLQAGRDLVILQGVDAATVNQIIDSRAEILRQEFTAEALSKVDERVDALTHAIFSKFSSPKMFEAFSDPDFQFNVLEAQRSASRSGDDDDVDLLADLLSLRAEYRDSARLKMATRRALDVVGQLSHEGVTGLSALWFGLTLSCGANYLGEFLGFIDEFVAPLLSELPSGTNWISDLQVLDCVIAGHSGIGNLFSYPRLFANHVPLFVSAGVPALVDEFSVELEAAASGLSRILVPHPLDDARLVPVGANETITKEIAGQIVGKPLSADVIAALDRVLEASQTGQLPRWEELVREKFDEYPNLKAFDAWWHDFPPLAITAVGTAVAYANFRRIHPGRAMPLYSSLF
jgi:hypothetical protein